MKGFKEFILKGNIVDMAVGVIIGGAFGKIVTSLVNDILMPLISTLLGVIDFSMLTLTIGKSTINYGMFIQNIVDFLIIGFTLYMILKVAMKASEALHPKKEEEPPAPAAPTEVELLTEIRDMLKANN